MGGLVGALPVSALSSCALSPAVDEVKEGASDAKNGKITFLQTTDVHCQLHQHDELFCSGEYHRHHDRRCPKMAHQCRRGVV